ncbi:hypothetical protein GECvBMG_gp239c [Salmonella phage GEC_vB_MG]|nr:hypothetical protein GECvBMG_gp239c [Salmonella phage GEC_vB_MG]
MGWRFLFFELTITQGRADCKPQDQIFFTGYPLKLPRFPLPLSPGRIRR